MLAFPVVALRTELHLARHADSAWSAVVRPWLETARGRLERACVVVATRGQAHGCKQRCIEEGVPLLGVEFLTPGLARKKWLTATDHQTSALGRELLLYGLRLLVARRLAPLTPADPEWGFWQSLQSDPARALDDFDALLQAGRGAADFPLAPLRSVFSELGQWVAARGYVLAPEVARRAAREPLPPSGAPIAERALVYGLGVESAGEFFNLAAFVRHCAEVTVVLPEPTFAGRTDADERWVESWSELLGVDALPLDVPEPGKNCERVGLWWSGQGGATNDGGGPGEARVLAGRTQGDEMALVADEIATLLQRGADNVAVIFPRADAAHLELMALLAARGVPFSDLMGGAGPPALDVQTQRALLAYFEQGARLEELLAMWPLLRAAGLVSLAPGEARRVCAGSFDSRPTHAVAGHVGAWADRAPELARVARILLPAWPDALPLADGLQRFRGACRGLGIEEPEGWGALDALAARGSEPVPVAVVTATLASFLPASARVGAAPGSGFARVTLTTRRRAEGLAWSHAIFVECNAGIWPVRTDPGCWLTDDQRRALQTAPGTGPGLFASEERAALERAGYQAIARNVRREIVFSAALFSAAEPELRLAPNAWLERVLWQGNLAGVDGDFESVLENLAGTPAVRQTASSVDAWHDVWRGRRDPTRSFDEYFFCGDPRLITPDKISAGLIERAVRDPAELWFDGVLQVRRAGWEPLVRPWRKGLGQRAHRLLAAALQPAGVRSGEFGELPARAEAERRLTDALVKARSGDPPDCYWDSFHAELAQVCARLLDNVFVLDAGRYLAVETWLPEAAHLKLGARKLRVTGRLDLVRLDHPAWRGTRVDIVDFKTGGDAILSVTRMGRSGASLQLGVYLAAALSLGAIDGNVWMVKPEPGAATPLAAVDLPAALARLSWLTEALDRGCYGALTRDRSDYAPDGVAWPLACTPVPAAALARKFAATFGHHEGDSGDD